MPHDLAAVDSRAPADNTTLIVCAAFVALEVFAAFCFGSVTHRQFFLDAPTNGNGAEAWILFRASGTEPLLRIYCEAASPELVEEILATGEKFAQGT